MLENIGFHYAILLAGQMLKKTFKYIPEEIPKV